MTENHAARGIEPNIVPMGRWPGLLDTVFLDAHRLVDQIPRDRLIDLIPLLRRAAQAVPAGASLSEPVDEKNLSSAARMEPPMASSVANKDEIAG